jgi:Flp pilus assembly protein TadB
VAVGTPTEALDSVYGLAAKYDLLLYDTRNRVLHLPLEDLAEYASATFWPAGAIRAAIAGGVGLGIAVVAWFAGIPVLSGIAIVIGGFLVVMAVYTFVHEGRRAMRARQTGGEPPAGD